MGSFRDFGGFGVRVVGLFLFSLFGRLTCFADNMVRFRGLWEVVGSWGGGYKEVKVVRL